MIKTFRLFLYLTLSLILLASCNILGNGDGDGSQDSASISDAAFFSLPSSLTGDSADPRAAAPTTGIASTIENFYGYARDQVNFAGQTSDQIKALIAKMEEAGLFDYEAALVLEDNTGDRYRWTIGPGTDEYFLEWWMIQADSTYLKFLEIKLDEYISTDSAASARGHVIIAPPANYLDSWHGDPQYVRVDFDSDNDEGKQYMKIQMADFMGPDLTLEGTPPLYQEGILQAWKSSDGTIEVASSVLVPGIDTLNYAHQLEDRYYLFHGISLDGKATVSLSMPLRVTGTGDYDEANPFISDRIGDVIQEYFCDEYRAETGLTTLNNINLINGSALDASSTTVEIVAEIEAIDTTGLSTENAALVEELLYLMDVDNPAYFNETVFAGEETAPDSTYLTLESTTGISSQADLDGLTITFAEPGDMPPDVTL